MSKLSSIAVSEDGKSETSKARSEKRPDGGYKQGRLVIRNLQFDIKEKHLIKHFAKFGQIIDVNVPLNPENNLNKGFGFVEFKTKEMAVNAISKSNAQKYKGRLISVDFALSKLKYDGKVQKMNMATKESKDTPDAASDKSDDAIKEEDNDWEISSLEDERDSKSKKDDKKGDKKDDKKKPKAEKKVTITKETPVKEEAPQEKPKKRDDKREKKTNENDAEEGLTLFVRNIDYSANEADLLEFFEDFGQIYFVKLVRSRENPGVHKGTAFVKFKSPGPVEELANISNEYWSTDKQTASKAHMTNLESRLEFKGRRLAMFKAETKGKRNEAIEESKVKKDKRNLDYLKLGLVTTKEFVHEGVSQTDMDTRVRLFQEKQKALKANPNLFISKTRLRVRNIDKRMTEKGMNEFVMSFCEDWKKTLPNMKQKELSKVKMITQLKVLRNPDSVDESGQPKSTGAGFIELFDEDLALFLVRNLNNYITNLKREKGLIVDYSTEDHRKLLKRKQKSEAFEVKLKQAKKERKKKQKEEKAKYGDLGIPDDEKVTIDQITDVDELRRLLEGCTSRGRRSRLKKKIARVTGEPLNPQDAKRYDRLKENGKMDQEQFDNRSVKPIDQNIAVEKGIAKDVKKNMKRKHRMKIKSEEEVDSLLKSFEERIQKKLKKMEEAGDEVPVYKEKKQDKKKSKKAKNDDSDSGFDDVDIDEI